MVQQWTGSGLVFSMGAVGPRQLEVHQGIARSGFVDTVHVPVHAQIRTAVVSWLKCVHGANCDMHARQQQQVGTADRPGGVFHRLRVHTQQQSLGI